MLNIRNRAARVGAVVGVALLALAGCTSTPPATMADSVEVTDEAWAKAGVAGGMVGAFVTLENTTDTDVELTAVESPTTPRVELHEMVPGDSGEMKMKKIDGNLVIPAGEVFKLEPGGNHIMLMDLPADVMAGSEIELTLKFTDGSEKTIKALVKTYSAANEEYVGEDGMNHDDMAEGEMNHGDMGDTQS